MRQSTSGKGRSVNFRWVRTDEGEAFTVEAEVASVSRAHPGRRSGWIPSGVSRRGRRGSGRGVEAGGRDEGSGGAFPRILARIEATGLPGTDLFGGPELASDAIARSGQEP